MKTVRDCLIASVVACCAVLACTAQSARTAVDVVRVLCPDLSCVDTILADPNVDPAFKAELKAKLHR